MYLKILLSFITINFIMNVQGQQKFTAEILWSLGRINSLGISKDQQSLIYEVAVPNIKENKIDKKLYKISVNGGNATEVHDKYVYINNDRISPDGKFILSSEEVLLKKVMGKDKYEDLSKTTGQVYTSLNYRHWDNYFDGKFSHVFFAENKDGAKKTDIMYDEPYFTPTQPFGGDEDFIWSPDSKNIIYVSKKKYGTAYSLSTNTDIYQYNIESQKTVNLTESNKGYDVAPAFNGQSTMAWLQMKRDGYEADKNDIVTLHKGKPVNLTNHADYIHVESFKWANDNQYIYFIAPIQGTLQLFKVNDIALSKAKPVIQQITKGDFDIKSIIGEINNKLYVLKEDFNHAAEIYALDLSTKILKQITHINDDIYKNIQPSFTERRWIKTTDNKNMMLWVVYPPNFDKNKKYPTLLYCQGGPQSPITQFYSFRWNMQLIAAQGYIVVMPLRRGMQGFGTQWNEQISKDWGGQVMKDYLTAIDVFSKEKFVDTMRRGAIGASFGGYSVFKLAGIHQGRFKTFIAHDGVFDFRSMFGTTDELFFEYWEKGGAYWEKNNKIAQRSFAQSPSEEVENWDTPIYIIQGEKDYRVSIGQGQQAFQAAQLKGLKSKFLLFPDENHWVLKPQNALMWQREFFSWLNETL